MYWLKVVSYINVRILLALSFSVVFVNSGEVTIFSNARYLLKISVPSGLDEATSENSMAAVINSWEDNSSLEKISSKWNSGCREGIASEFVALKNN